MKLLTQKELIDMRAYLERNVSKMTSEQMIEMMDMYVFHSIIVPCKKCGKEFIKKRATEKLCSSECRKRSQSHSRRKQKLKKNPFSIPRPLNPNPFCKHCEKPLPPGSSVHRLYCDHKCRRRFDMTVPEKKQKALERMRSYMSKRRSSFVTVKSVCKFCSVVYDKTREDRIYCSPKCRKENKYLRDQSNRINKRRAKVGKRKCKCCNNEMLVTGHLLKKYCNADCRNRYYFNMIHHKCNGKKRNVG